MKHPDFHPEGLIHVESSESIAQKLTWLRRRDYIPYLQKIATRKTAWSRQSVLTMMTAHILTWSLRYFQKAYVNLANLETKTPVYYHYDDDSHMAMIKYTGYADYSEPLQPWQKFILEEAFAEYEKVLNVDFIETTKDKGTVGKHIYFPVVLYGLDDNNGSTMAFHNLFAGLYFNKKYLNANKSVSDALLTAIHETGHGMGLGHSFISFSGDNFTDKDLSYYDNYLFTVMSYRQNYNYTFDNVHPSTLMNIDIEILHKIFGRNYQTNSKDTTFSWEKGLSFMECLFANEGIHTIDVSNLEQRAIISLVPETISSIGRHYRGGPALCNVSISQDTWITKVNGTPKNDIIMGNKLGNILYGGAGDDYIHGGFGVNQSSIDYLRGEAGNDFYAITADKATIDPLLGAPIDSNKARKTTNILDREGHNYISLHEFSYRDLTINKKSDTSYNITVNKEILNHVHERVSVQWGQNSSMHLITKDGLYGLGDPAKEMAVYTNHKTQFSLEDVPFWSMIRLSVGSKPIKDIKITPIDDNLPQKGTGLTYKHELIALDKSITIPAKDLHLVMFRSGELTGNYRYKVSVSDGKNWTDPVEGTVNVMQKQNIGITYTKDILHPNQNYHISEIFSIPTGMETIELKIDEGVRNSVYFMHGNQNKASLTVAREDLHQVKLFTNLNDKVSRANIQIRGKQRGVYTDWLTKRFLLISNQNRESIHRRGSIHNDIIKGSEFNDELRTKGGQNIIEGKGGDDIIMSHNGHDILKGDGGNDLLSAGDGNDQVYGGQGNDQLKGEKGNDALFGDDGDDHLEGGEGNDMLFGGKDNDKLWGNFGENVLDGGAGDDIIHTGKGYSRVLDSEGRNHIYSEGLGNQHEYRLIFQNPFYNTIHGYTFDDAIFLNDIEKITTISTQFEGKRDLPIIQVNDCVIKLNPALHQKIERPVIITIDPLYKNNLYVINPEAKTAKLYETSINMNTRKLPRYKSSDDLGQFLGESFKDLKDKTIDFICVYNDDPSSNLHTKPYDLTFNSKRSVGNFMRAYGKAEAIRIGTSDGMVTPFITVK